MALSICVFVADSADAQLAYLRVVLPPVLGPGLLPPPHDSRKAAMPLKETPNASERKIKSRRLIRPASRSCSSWFMSLIDITPIFEGTMKDNHRKTVIKLQSIAVYCSFLLFTLVSQQNFEFALAKGIEYRRVCGTVGNAHITLIDITKLG